MIKFKTFREEMDEKEKNWMDGGEADFTYMPKDIWNIHTTPKEFSAWTYMASYAEKAPIPEGYTSCTFETVSKHLKITVTEAIVVLYSLEQKMMIEIDEGKICILPSSDWRLTHGV